MQSALKVLLNKKDTDTDIAPTSPLFMNDSIPPKMLFDLSVNSGNYTLNQLQLQQHIAKQEVRIAQSGYLPNIALFGKQTLYSHGIQSNLLPRTMVGIGFTWNLFDGLDQFFRQMTPNTAPYDVKVNADALTSVFEKTGDAVFVTHSQGCGIGWLIGMQSDHVKGIVAYEPGSGFPFPKGGQ